MSVMEPDLILHPILERAVPSLEALVEVSFHGSRVSWVEILILILDLIDSKNDGCN